MSNDNQRRNKTYDELHKSAAMGGSFNCAIIKAFFKADPNNTRRLIEAFPEVFTTRVQ